MGAEDHDWNHLPWWCWVAPLLAAALVVAKLTHLVAPDGLVFVVLPLRCAGEPSLRPSTMPKFSP
jgi:hypothetical protein